MPAFEALPGMPYWQDLITPGPQKAAYFYSKLLGWEISQDTYRVARKDGLPVAGIVAAEEATPAWVVYFLGQPGDSARLAGRVEEHGGAVVSTADVALGHLTVCQDPQGSLFGFVEPAGEDQFVAAGEPGVPVWYEYVAPSEAAIDFYAELFDLELVREGDYVVAVREGAPFLGFLLIDDAELAPSAGFWQIFFGAENARRAAHMVGEFGGEVIAGPERTAFGEVVVAQDPTKAGFYLCEVEAPNLEDARESDSVLDL